MRCIHVIRDQKAIKSLTAVPNSKTIISSHYDTTTVKLWNLPTGELIHTFDAAHECCVAISPDGLNMASADGTLSRVNGYTIQLWDFQNRKLLFNFDAHSKQITAVAFIPNRSNLLKRKICAIGIKQFIINT